MSAAASLSVGGLLVTPPCPWLPVDIDAAAARVVHEAHACLGICEEPPGSNRGPQIDQWNRDAGVPVGSYWCGSMAGAHWRSAGLEVPRGYASCDVLMAWAKKTGRWSQHVPSLGALVLYGVGNDAHHVGIVIRASPVVMSAEGNTLIDSGFSRNGIGVGLKLVTSTDPLLGYCHIRPL